MEFIMLKQICKSPYIPAMVIHIWPRVYTGLDADIFRTKRVSTPETDSDALKKIYLATPVP